MRRCLLKLDFSEMAECNVEITRRLEIGFKAQKVHIPDELVAKDLQGAYLLFLVFMFKQPGQLPNHQTCFMTYCILLSARM